MGKLLGRDSPRRATDARRGLFFGLSETPPRHPLNGDPMIAPAVLLVFGTLIVVLLIGAAMRPVSQGDPFTV